MDDEYIKDLQKLYNFEDITSGMSLDEGYSVTAMLTPMQIQLFNSKQRDLDMFRVKAEMYSARKSNIPLGWVPKTTILGKGNLLKIVGSPDTIAALFAQLFS